LKEKQNRKTAFFDRSFLFISAIPEKEKEPTTPFSPGAMFIFSPLILSEI